MTGVITEGNSTSPVAVWDNDDKTGKRQFEGRNLSGRPTLKHSVLE